MSLDIHQQVQQTKLPIVRQLSNICKTLSEHQNLVLQAEPGAGKTTLVPLVLLDIIPANKKILLLEPRRLAARNAAARMSKLLGEPLGQTVGFRIRNETKVSSKTRIEVITEGILTRMLQSDPELEEVGLIIFDEFHERSLDADLGLAFSIEVQQNLREDLKILVMSATLDTTAISILLDNAPIIHCEGRCYPVEIKYLPPKTTSNKYQWDWLNSLSTAVREILNGTIQKSNKKHAQDILIFLPGISEIRKVDEILTNEFSETNNLQISHLYGDLPFKQQQQVLLPIEGKRKIILSTNIAETSVTINGIGFVIDSGLMRQSAFDPNVGFNRLTTKRISTASATQRSGRAGRLTAGYCYRLWSDSESLRNETVAEIKREDLSSFVLELSLWGITEPSDLKLLEQPNQGMFSQAQSLLKSLKAIDQSHKITPHGKALSSLGIHPRMAHMLVESIALGCCQLACLIAAMLEEKDLLTGEQGNNPDVMARVNVLFDQHSNSFVKKQIIKQSHLLFNKVKRLNGFNKQIQKTAEDCKYLTAILLAMVFPDRIAQKRGNGYRLANGTGVVAHDNFVIDDDFMVVVKLGGHGSSPRIFQAIGLSNQELFEHFSDLIEEKEDVEWDNKAQSVKAQLNEKFGELLLSSKPVNQPDPQLIINGLIQGISKRGIEQLPWTKELRQWQARVQMLKNTGNEEFPDLSNNHLQQSIHKWLAPFLSGLSKLSQVNSDILSQAIKSLLDWPMQQKLDELMPLSIKVASGSNIKLDYSQIDKPILAVKLQEMFGEKQTPSIANGKLKVVIHLLSPARRQLQITDDLESFWENGYVEVKKQMRGKYPRHPWPDDPLQAVATRHTKKRSNK